MTQEQARRIIEQAERVREGRHQGEARDLTAAEERLLERAYRVLDAE